MSWENSIEISPSPKGLELQYNKVFSKNALHFVYRIVTEFESRVVQMLRNRKMLKLNVDANNQLPDFTPMKSDDWKIDPLPCRLKTRHLDLGDVSPSMADLLKDALKSNVQGIQVDFDDGHCPSWKNQISGIHNIISIVEGDFYPDEVPKIDHAPLLLMRPRAWNMGEHNIMINGKEIPGALMDFGLLIYHTGTTLFEKSAGPYFYLPKLENAFEAKLWDDILTYAEFNLHLPHGVIKACVLIENIFAAFEAEQILYELRHHSFGLNCGVWDYCASIINKFGANKDFIIPDRNKYVNLDQAFLYNYMRLVISVCKKHEAPVTGGMIPYVLNEYASAERSKILVNILKGKKKEINMGVDGFLTYDHETVVLLQNSFFSGPIVDNDALQPLTEPPIEEPITKLNLLGIPHPTVTHFGLWKNIRVSILFIYSWISEGKGHFVSDGTVEDSATAEISRSQVWQWILHEVHLEDESKEKITKACVSQLAWKTYAELINCEAKIYVMEHLHAATEIFMELVTTAEFPEFMTTYLYNHSTFRKLQET